MLGLTHPVLVTLMLAKENRPAFFPVASLLMYFLFDPLCWRMRNDAPVGKKAEGGFCYKILSVIPLGFFLAPWTVTQLCAQL